LNILVLPVLLLMAPFVLSGYAWQERRRVCPLCGQRGTLQPVQVPWNPGEVDHDRAVFKVVWQRVRPERAVLSCTACGLSIRRIDLVLQADSRGCF
jgi:hypothetical protein